MAEVKGDGQMKGKSLSILLSIALALGVLGCKTNAKSESTELMARQQAVASPRTAANIDNPSSQIANELQENKTDPTSYSKDPDPPPPLPSSKGLTKEVMKNVDFHPDDLLVYRIRTIRGSIH